LGLDGPLPVVSLVSWVSWDVFWGDMGELGCIVGLSWVIWDILMVSWIRWDVELGELGHLFR
jgi:hypothetical protein